MKVDIHAVQELSLIKQHMSELKELLGTNVALAGGSLSDLSHGLIPKDYDLWVLYNPTRSLEKLVTDFLNNHLFVTNLEKNDKYTGSETLIFKYKLGRLSVDFIFAGTKAKTFNELVDNFDVNISKRYISTEDLNQVVVLPEATDSENNKHILLVNKTPLTLNTSGTSSIERLKRYVSKFSPLGYEVTLDDGEFLTTAKVKSK